VTAFLRPARESDLTEIARIERSCFADPWSEDSFRRLLDVPPATFLVAVASPDSPIAGYVVAFSVEEDAEILNVAVDSPFRGRGLAGQMLDAVLIDLAARRVHHAFLEVRESNAAALALYGSRGFAEIGRRKGYYRRPAEDALVMRRVIDVPDGDKERSAGSFADR
jgi:[ribosomal protein S18]-alanine N-acetyltransferase